MPKLTEAHIEQIKNMKEDGKKGPEIIKFFKDTYKIHLRTAWQEYKKKFLREVERAINNA